MEVQVSTVSRIDERIDEAPGNVYVFPRSVIQNRGYRSLGELLRIVPGFTVFHRDLQFVTGVRGLNANDNEKVTLLINGQELNNVIEPGFLNGPINLDNVERVEVVVGPSSLFQRANTLAATINVITKDVSGAELLFAFGNSTPYSGTLMLGQKWEDRRFVSFSFSTEEKKGFDAWPADFRPNLAGKEQTGQLNQPSFFSTLRAQRDDFSAQLVAYRSDAPELLINNGDPSNDGHMVDQWYSLLLRHQRQWTPTLQTRLQADATYKGQTRLNMGGPPINALQVSAHQLDYTFEASALFTGLWHQSIQAGVQAAFEDNFDTWFSLNTDALTIPKTTLVSKDTWALGFFLDDEFQPFKWLKLVAGARVDHNTILAGDRWYVGGRGALIFLPTTNWVAKLTYNRAVRMPTPVEARNDVWGNDKPDAPPFANTAPNATKPEILNTVEAQGIAYLGPVRTSVSVYYQFLDGFISWFQPWTNVGDFSGTGAEVTVQAPIHPRFNLWTNVSYNASTLKPEAEFREPSDESVEQHHIVTNGDGRLVGAPRFTANLGFDWEVKEALFLSPSARYFTDQAAFDFTTQSFTTIDNRFYLDATLTLKKLWDDKLDLRLIGHNLLNNRDPVAGQWLRSTYKPRGIEVLFQVDLRL